MGRNSVRPSQSWVRGIQPQSTSLFAQNSMEEKIMSLCDAGEEEYVYISKKP